MVWKKNCSKSSLLIAMLFMLLLTITGCPGKEAQQKPESQGQKVKIGVSLASMQFDGNKSIKQFIDQRKKQNNVDIVWMDAQMDPAKQEKDVEQLIKQKVRAIVLQVVDPMEGAKLVDKISQAKIKVIGLETLPVNAPLDGYIAADHVRAGELQGLMVLKNSASGSSQQGGQSTGQQGSQGQGGNQGQQGQQGGQAQSKNVLILAGDPGDPVAAQIATAAENVLKQGQFKVKVTHLPKADPELAQMTVQESLKSSKPAAILSTNGPMADAAVQVLKKQGLDKQVITVGVGADQKNSQALTSGEHDAEVDTNPEQLANFALEAALDLVKKGSWNSDSRVQNGNFDIPARIVPVRLIQKDQAYLLADRWGNLKKEQGQQKQQSEQQGSSQGGGSSGEGSSAGGSGGSSGQGSSQTKGKKTKVKITTQDGKVMEVEVEGEVKAIQSEGTEKGKHPGGGQQSNQGGGEGSQSGGQ